MKFPKVITIACEKGGVGKTTVATNLAVYLKALREDLPVTVFSFDNHFTVDRMFSIEKRPYPQSVKDIFDGAEMAGLARMGQYGVSFIPSARRLDPPGGESLLLLECLAHSRLEGIVIMDTRPVLDWFTRAALLASDMVIVPIKDLPSLNNIAGITDLYDEFDQSPPEIRLLPSIVDGMVRFRNNTITMDQFLRSVSTERGYDLMAGSIPKSPKVESLTTNLTFEVYPVIHHAAGTQAHKGFGTVAREVLASLDEKREPRSLLHYRRRHFDEPGPDNRKYRQRMESVLPYCPLCAEEISSRTLYIKPDMCYFESGGRTRGFVDVGCLTRHLLAPLSEGTKENAPFMERLGRFMGEEGILALSASAEGEKGHPAIILTLCDDRGEMRETARFGATAALQDVVGRLTEPTPLGPAPALICLGGAPIPDSIMLESRYARFQDGKLKALLQLGKTAGRSA